jgi:threonylcarbamoyladenosine tRNA methylthiotransferase MtaB
LIHEISKIKDLKRIRISSIEVTELNDKMLLEIEKNEKIVNHFHVPLQAGSNEILKSMNRKYDLCYFEEKLKRLRQLKKEVSITTDVIVGFPGETEALFLKTVETVKKFEFSKIHVFPYSIRTGTLASQMINQVLDSEKHQRSQILNQISLELEQQFLKSFFNQELEVLIEQVFENYSIGTTSNYIKVRLNKKMNKNEFVKVKIVTCQETYLIGEELIYIS